MKLLRRSACLALMLALCGASAQSQVPSASAGSAKRVTVVSALGDTVTLVRERDLTGSQLDRNLQQRIVLNDDVLDRTALLAARRLIQAHDASLKVSLLAVLDPTGQGAGDGNVFLTGGRFTPNAELRGELERDQPTHVVLLTRLRGETVLDTGGGASLGIGRIEGLGFYVNRYQGMVLQSSGERSDGFMAPFASVRVSLIDVGSGKVLAEAPLRQNLMVASSQSRDGIDPWNAMTAAQKVDSLKRLLESGLQRVLPPLLASL